MSNNFAEMKKSRTTQLENLTKKLTSNDFTQSDETEWKITRDKAGNGTAVIRFLPAAPNNEDPYVIVYDHAFQGPAGKWYIEKSLTTLGRGHTDPVSEHNAALWAAGDKDGARAQRRRTSYWSNIYVVEDPGKPENEGKVFKFRYGKKIFDMLKEVMSPSDPEDTAFNPFDLWEGANFRMKVTTVDKYPNYDKSKFSAPKPLLDNEEQLEGIWKAEYDLSKLIDASIFKSYDELKKRLNDVLGLDVRSVSSLLADEDSPSTVAPKSTKTKPAAAPKAADDGDDELAWLAELENGLED